MIIKFYCPECEAKIEADALDCGDVFPCPVCESDIQVPDEEFGPGVAIGAFKILKKIGEGGMGTVYLAEQTSLRRIVALKVLSPALTSSDDFIENFTREMQVQGSIAHPNIVAAFDAGSDRNIHYLAMEYIEGEELETLLEREGILPEDRAINITRQVASGMMHAWKKRQIVHRDIKPGNIMIDDQGGAQLLDLGLSTSIVHGDESDGPRYMVGTPQYMPPEQVRGEDGIDFRADIYALGGTLYHMVTGRPPHEGSSVTEVTTKQVESEVEDPRSLNPDISEPCYRLISRMLNKDPMQRFSSWDRLVDALDLVSDHVRGGVATVQTPVVNSALSPERTNKFVLGFGVLGFLALIVAMFSMVQNTEPDEQGDSNPLPPPARLITEMGNPSSPPVDLEPTVPVPEIEANNQEGANSGAPLVSPSAPPSKTGDLVSLEQLLVAADQSVNTNPRAYDENIVIYDRLLKTARETGHQEIISEIEGRIAQQSQNKSDAIREVMQKLEQQARQLIADEKPQQAVELYRRYRGPLMEETRSERMRLGSRLATELRKEIQRPAQELAAWNGILDRIATDLVERRTLEDAIVTVEEVNRGTHSASSGNLPDILSKLGEGKRKEWERLQELLDEADPENVEELILKTFADHVGKGPIKIQTISRGTKTYEVRGIDPPDILVKFTTSGVTGEMGIKVSDLVDSERAARIRAKAPSEADFLLGTHYLLRGQDTQARFFFEQVEHPIGMALVKKLEKLATENAAMPNGGEPDQEAMSDLNEIFELADIRTFSPNPVPRLMVRQLSDKSYSAQRVRLLKLASRRYWEVHGETRVGEKYAGFIDAVLGLAIPNTSLHSGSNDAPRLVFR